MKLFKKLTGVILLISVILVGLSEAQTPTGPTSGLTIFRKNAIINGGFSIAQRGTSFTSATTPANNDDTYLSDRWILLSDGNDIVDVSQQTALIGTPYNNQFLVATVSKKFGYLTILEYADSQQLDGKTVSLSFDAAVINASAGRLDNIKAVVLTWAGTADSVTSDVVSAWGAEDTTPTWATNWTTENTPSNLNVTTSAGRYKIEGIAIDSATVNNIAVFIWADGLTGTLSDWLRIANVQLEVGSGVTDYEYHIKQDELNVCLNYFERVGNSAADAYMYANGLWQDAITLSGVMVFNSKRVSPTITFSSATSFVVRIAGSFIDVTSLSFNAAYKNSAQWVVGVASGGTAGQGTYLYGDATTNNYIDIDAEL